MKPIRLQDPPSSPRGGVPEIFEAGGVYGVVRRAVVIGNGLPGAENQCLGLVRALGLADNQFFYRVTRPRGGLNDWLQWLPVSVHKRLHYIVRLILGNSRFLLKSGGTKVGALLSAKGSSIGLSAVLEADVQQIISMARQTFEKEDTTPKEAVCIAEGAESGDEDSFSKGVLIQFRKEEESRAFCAVFARWKKEAISQGVQLPNGSLFPAPKSKFDDKIEASSAKMYFHYYGQLLHQQNMLQDYVRTGTYYAALMENRVDFFDRVVVDVGAGSGILSFFAAQAGAKHVYAVEASEMAEYARVLVEGNPFFRERITVIKGKVEEVELPEKADILISEPMGTLLVNERMLESYVIARDRFLVSNGKMFPGVGRIHVAPFSDEYLYVELANKALFWQQQNYFGVDLTPLHGSAFQGYFSQPVVDAFDPRLLVAPAVCHVIDFNAVKEEQLYDINIPLRFTSSVGTRIHGVACWFDVLFNGSSVQRWLTTAPGAPTTHWYQLRCVLAQPIYVMSGQEITGNLHMVAHNAQSYTVYLTLSAKMWGPAAEQGGILQTSSGKLELKEPYYRMSQPQAQAYAVAQEQQPHQLVQPQDIQIQTPDIDSSELFQQQFENACSQLP